MEEEKDKLPAEGDQPENEKPVKGVSKTEFNKFQKEVSGTLGNITEALGGMMETLNELKAQPKIEADSNGVRVTASLADDAGPQSEAMVPQAWRRLTDEILGTDFEISLRLPENGGQIFEIMVPREKSNATKDHWEMHKRDKRSRELGNTGIKGVKDYLLKVRKNIAASGIKLPYYENTEPQLISTR